MQRICDAVLLQKGELDVEINLKYIIRDIPVPSPDNTLIKVIIGPRRAGKSSFAFRAFHSTATLSYVNFDDETLVNAGNYDEVINRVQDIYQNPSILLLDEITNIRL